jgi:hypothetical protein
MTTVPTPPLPLPPDPEAPPPDVIPEALAPEMRASWDLWQDELARRAEIAGRVR